MVVCNCEHVEAYVQHMVSQSRGTIEKRVCRRLEHVVADKGLLIYHRYIRTTDNTLYVLIGVLKVGAAACL